jgi:thiamine biosynthesis lipoprotein
MFKMIYFAWSKFARCVPSRWVASHRSLFVRLRRCAQLSPRIRAAAFGFAGAFFCISCIPQQGLYYEESGSVFHTLYHIKYQSPEILTDKIDAELQTFNLSMNPFNPNSIISKVNRNEDVEVDDLFVTVFNKAMEVSENSGGVFDVTIAPLINLWGFGFENSDSVSQQNIDSIKAFVGYRKVHLDGRKVIKDDPRIRLNFSAIAKGYASDVIAALLEREGVNNYMVFIGGEVTAKGKNPNGACWHIGIEKPEDDVSGIQNEYEDTILLCNKSGIATSGNYRNFYIKDGKKYAHTIDPRTGYPSEKSILSATIIAADCITADAYATAFMAMGVEPAIAMAEKIPEIEYYIIYNDTTNGYTVKFSEGVKAMLRQGQRH